MSINEALFPRSITAVFTHDPGADEIIQFHRFPNPGRVLAAYSTNTAAIATATNTIALYLVKFSSAATPAVQGTLGSWSASGGWTADVPRTMTLTGFGSTALFAQGENVRVQYDETTTGTWTEMNIQVDYIPGYDI